MFLESQVPGNHQPHARLATVNQIGEHPQFFQQRDAQCVGLVDQQHNPAAVLLGARELIDQGEPQFALVQALVGNLELKADGLQQFASGSPRPGR